MLLDWLLHWWGGGRFEPFCIGSAESLASGVSSAATLAGIANAESLAGGVINAAILAAVSNAESLAGGATGTASECD